MLRSNSVIAWVLAINRLYTLSDAPETSPLHLSCHEFGVNEVSVLRSTAAILAPTRRTSICSTTRSNCSWTWCGRWSTPWKQKTGTPLAQRTRGLYAKHLGAALGLKARVCQRIYLAGLLHDVGKIACATTCWRTPAFE